QKRLNNLIEENYLKIWLQEDKKTVITEEMRYFTIYHIQGCLSVLNHWVESTFAYSKKKMLTFLRLLNDNIEPIMP
ncbi:MAG: TetR family transcriptional regulator C-terminal domain-containing protein, partial [Enterococcus durans]|nr:TetR family transcriptional regulator C-terminal domain-containing protein [Enterococcus durans]